MSSSRSRPAPLVRRRRRDADCPAASRRHLRVGIILRAIAAGIPSSSSSPAPDPSFGSGTRDHSDDPHLPSRRPSDALLAVATSVVYWIAQGPFSGSSSTPSASNPVSPSVLWADQPPVLSACSARSRRARCPRSPDASPSPASTVPTGRPCCLAAVTYRIALFASIRSSTPSSESGSPSILPHHRPRLPKRSDTKRTHRDRRPGKGP